MTLNVHEEQHSAAWVPTHTHARGLPQDLLAALDQEHLILVVPLRLLMCLCRHRLWLLVCPKPPLLHDAIKVGLISGRLRGLARLLATIFAASLLALALCT